MENIDEEFKKYNRDINGNYIIRNRDKCMIGFGCIIATSVVIFNIYLLGKVFLI
jgi:hypothetical protein